ncbi:uncharacterized protein [Salvelinus sp. IW2-2015]|uniref:uncharacterized protein n=1 Tax=Salvelinus sp. IW2-2015 TaxID=2691554 RepID=UPI0038D4254E
MSSPNWRGGGPAQGEREQTAQTTTTLEELLTKWRTEQDSSLATQLKEVQQERDGLKRELADQTKEQRNPAQPARLPPWLLHPSPQPTEQPPTDSGTDTDQPHPSSNTHQPPSPPHQKTLADIVCLMDSRRKYFRRRNFSLDTNERRDFHPATIQRINASLSRDCALRPNVHLAHHPTLDLDCLYDHGHLYRETVPILAKTLKDVALNRSPTSPPRNSGAISTPPRSPRQHPRPAPWTPQPRPQHHQPQCPPQPAQHRPPQPSFRATQTRPPTPLPPTADPHLKEPQPSRQSYAQAVRGATGPSPTNQMSDIKQMLSLLCSHVMGRGSW